LAAAIRRWAPLLNEKVFLLGRRAVFLRSFAAALPTHTISAKVRLADLIYVNKNTESRQSHLNRICSKHVDFLVWDSNLALVVAIELDDSSHEEEDRQSRDSFIDAAFSAANFPLIRIPCKRGCCCLKLDRLKRSSCNSLFLSAVVPYR